MIKADEIGRRTACERLDGRYPNLHVIGTALSRTLAVDGASDLPDRIAAALRRLDGVYSA